MKKVVLSIVAAASLAAAGSAMAQPYGYGRYDQGRYDQGRYDNANNVNARQQQIAWRIEQGQRSGQLSWREARNLRSQLNGIENLEHRYRSNGLNGWERADLDRRLDRLSAQIRYDRRDNEYGYGYGPGWRR